MTVVIVGTTDATPGMMGVMMDSGAGLGRLLLAAAALMPPLAAAAARWIALLPGERVSEDGLLPPLLVPPPATSLSSGPLLQALSGCAGR